METTKNDNTMSAAELSQILSSELRTLHKMEENDKNAARKIDKAKQIFNGAGKLIALASYITEARRIGAGSSLLELPKEDAK